MYFDPSIFGTDPNWTPQNPRAIELEAARQAGMDAVRAAEKAQADASAPQHKAALDAFADELEAPKRAAWAAAEAKAQKRARDAALAKRREDIALRAEQERNAVMKMPSWMFPLPGSDAESWSQLPDRAAGPQFGYERF